MPIVPPHAISTASQVQCDVVDDYSYSTATETRRPSLAVKRDRGRTIETPTTVSATVLNSAHSWYIENLQRLEAFRDMCSDWHETDAAAPNAGAINTSKKVLDWLSNVNVSPTRIDPSSAGGVCISFTNGDRYADIECLNSGMIVALIMDGDNKPEVWDLHPNNLPRAIATINGFVSR